MRRADTSRKGQMALLLRPPGGGLWLGDSWMRMKKKRYSRQMTMAIA